MIEKSGGNPLSLSKTHVGIFWAVQEKGRTAQILESRCSLEEAEPYGDMLTLSLGHYDVWEKWREDPRSLRANIASVVVVSEYEEWPRGRIVYSTRDERFVLYADAQILQRPSLVLAICHGFGLRADQTDTKLDDHYRSTKRLTVGMTNHTEFSE